MLLYFQKVSDHNKNSKRTTRKTYTLCWKIRNINEEGKIAGEVTFITTSRTGTRDSGLERRFSGNKQSIGIVRVR